MNGHKPWYKRLGASLTVLLAIIGAGTSLYFGVSAINESHDQDKANSRDQLFTLVEDLADGPKTNLAAQVEAEEAAHLIHGLGNDVSTSAAYQVATAFANNGELQNALQYFKLATQPQLPDSGLTAGSGLVASAYRGEAQTEFVLRKLKLAETDIQQAYDAETPTTGFGPEEIAHNQIFTKLFNVGLYLGVPDCSDAKKELAAARALLSQAHESTQARASDTKLASQEEEQFGPNGKPARKKSEAAHPTCPAAARRKAGSG